MEENDLSELHHAVRRLRAIRRIDSSEVDRRHKSEFSCESYPGGEIAHLVERQLLTTEFGYGSWREVSTDEMLRSALEYIDAEVRL